MTKKYTNTGKWQIPLITGILVVILWQFSVSSGFIQSTILPSPVEVVSGLLDDFTLILSRAAVTLFTSVTGLVLSIVFGLVISLAMDIWPVLRKAIYPYLVISQTIPIIFIYPVIMMGLGFGIAPKIVVVTLVCFFPICVNLSDGISNIDPELLLLLKSMNASKWKTLRIVKLPGALPLFFSGLKIAATYSVIGAVISEWLGAKTGLGVYMIRTSKSFAQAKVFAGIIVVVILSLAVFALVLLAERILLSWKYIKKEKVS